MGGGPSSEGPQEACQVEWLFPKIRTSVLSVFRRRQLFFIQAATFLMKLVKFALVVLVELVRERMSCVSSV